MRQDGAPLLGLGEGRLLASGDIFFRASLGVSLFWGIGCEWAACRPLGARRAGDTSMLVRGGIFLRAALGVSLFRCAGYELAFLRVAYLLPSRPLRRGLVLRTPSMCGI